MSARLECFSCACQNEGLLTRRGKHLCLDCVNEANRPPRDGLGRLVTRASAAAALRERRKTQQLDLFDGAPA